MSKNDLPVSWRHIMYLAATVFGPIVFSVGVILWTPPKPGSTESGNLVAASIVGFISLGLLAIIVATAKRRVIEISADSSVVKHSLYTLRIERSSVSSISVKEITGIEQIGLSTRKNGIAAFGYFSGWFHTMNGDPAFCAVSEWPVFLITFEGSLKCRHLALSASPPVVQSIAAWAET